MTAVKPLLSLLIVLGIRRKVRAVVEARLHTRPPDERIGVRER
jgi:hypothetical protein